MVGLAGGLAAVEAGASPAARPSRTRCFSPSLRGLAHTAFIVVVLAGLSPAVFAGEPDAVVARVNDVPLTRLEVMSEINRLLPSASYHGKIKKESWQRVVDRALENTVFGELAYQEAVKRGLKVDKGLIDEREKAAIARAGSKEAFRGLLRTKGMSRDDFRRHAKKSLMVQALYEQVLAGIAPEAQFTDADLKAYYDGNTKKFVVPESVDVQHLLIRVPPWAGKEQWERDERRSEWIAKRARGGEDFGKLVRTYSDDEASKKTGGKLSHLHGGKYAGPIRKISEDLEPGQIGGPVRSLYGYHIVKLLERSPARQLSYKDVNREQLKEDLRRKAVEERFEAWRGSLRKAGNVVLVQKQVDLLRSSPGG